MHGRRYFLEATQNRGDQPKGFPWASIFFCMPYDIFLNQWEEGSKWADMSSLGFSRKQRCCWDFWWDAHWVVPRRTELGPLSDQWPRPHTWRILIPTSMALHMTFLLAWDVLLTLYPNSPTSFHLPLSDAFFSPRPRLPEHWKHSQNNTLVMRSPKSGTRLPGIMSPSSNLTTCLLYFKFPNSRMKHNHTYIMGTLQRLNE
jgi:hypothetical protein